MPELGTYGSERGVPRNGHSYRDPGWVLREQGEDIDDPQATYLTRLTQMMFWPYNEKVQLMEERVYRGGHRSIRKCGPAEVITVQECREKLLPWLLDMEMTYDKSNL